MLQILIHHHGQKPSDSVVYRISYIDMYHIIWNLDATSKYSGQKDRFILDFFASKDQTETGSEKNQKCLNFKFRHLKTDGGGVSIFQKCLNYKLLSDPILKKKN